MSNKGYVYTTNAKLSSFLANRRMTDAVLESVDFNDKNVLDLGCGDGTYTIELFDRGHPKSMHGIDPGNEAVKIARKNTGNRKIVFNVLVSDRLPYEENSFDIVHIRGVLHHADIPINILREAIRVAPTLIIIEPNGFNPILKLIEKTSGYHLKHREKSYAPSRMSYWISNVKGAVVHKKYIGLVPVFCPDWMARFLKKIEPIIENTPILRSACCAQYVFVAKRLNYHHED